MSRAGHAQPSRPRAAGWDNPRSMPSFVVLMRGDMEDFWRYDNVNACPAKKSRSIIPNS